MIGITVAFATDHFTSDAVIGLLGLPDGETKSWLNTLYIAPFIVLAIWVAALLNREVEVLYEEQVGRPFDIRDELPDEND